MKGLKSKKLRLTVLSSGIAVLVVAAVLVYMPLVTKPARVRASHAANLVATPAHHNCSELTRWKGQLPYTRTVVQSENLNSDYAALFSLDDGSITVRPGYDAALAHEYGHALLVDLFAAYETNGDYYKAAQYVQNLTNHVQQDTTEMDGIPSWLLPVVQEYQTNNPAVQQMGGSDGYFNQNLSEYFAESFKVYCGVTNGGTGRVVPPTTRRFFEDVERGAF